MNTNSAASTSTHSAAVAVSGADPVTNVPWDAEFESVVRAALPGLSPDAPLSPSRPFVAMGLDSLGTVALVGRLQDHLGLSIPTSRLFIRDFRNAGDTWATLQRLTASL